MRVAVWLPVNNTEVLICLTECVVTGRTRFLIGFTDEGSALFTRCESIGCEWSVTSRTPLDVFQTSGLLGVFREDGMGRAEPVVTDGTDLAMISANGL